MSLNTAIPRFLLPRRGWIWTARLSMPSASSLSIRHASKKTSTKMSSEPFVLEKPNKFNPPSHGARLPKDAPRYPGPQLSAEEQARQKTKKYPNLMPPEGTFMHWFLNNKTIHIYISLGTLFTLATTVFVTNFKRTSPFADLIPPWSEIFVHPVRFCKSWAEVTRLTTAKNTAETMEKRKAMVEDVAKRAEYRKAHGLDQNQGFGGWTAKSNKQILGPGIPLEGENVEVEEGGSAGGVEGVVREKRPLRKWLGIW